jgi:hypothetical protein
MKEAVWGFKTNADEPVRRTVQYYNFTKIIL